MSLLEARLSAETVPRGTALVREGDDADTLYVVVTGRFSVEVAGTSEPVAEIPAGATIGEIAFFTRGKRTATVTAIRDSIVVALTRMDFDAISRSAPAIWDNIAATLATRLATETRKSASLKGTPKPSPRARTLTIVRAGDKPIPQAFLRAFLALAQSRPATLILSSSTLPGEVTAAHLDALDNIQALNDLEARYDTIIFVADETLTPWSEKAIRQADEVLLVGAHGDGPVGAAVPRTPLEDFSFSLDHAPRHRLVLVHPRRASVQGTRHWLAQRPVVMHHHAAIDDTDSLARLWRFISGEALGFVACGGGAYCASHIGLYKAFGEQGIGLDLFGGASGGAAMAAAFAQDIAADAIDAGVGDMFITGKAMQRYTLPRYGLLDHAHFDRHLKAQYGHTLIEDMWKPYFAVALDLGNYAIEILREGPVWAAIRASAAIPGLLPPYYTDDGRMLVDGSVASNVPADIMRSIKSGPNVVVTFDPPAGERLNVDYAALPGRRELALKMLTPWGRADLPAAPSAASVLVRSLMANRNHFERHVEPEDWLLMPPAPAGMGALDWRRHSELVESAYRYALAEITRRKAVKAPLAAT